MVIIEFAGPSCSGKSTIIDRLEQELQDEGYPLRALNAGKAAGTLDILRAIRNPSVRRWCRLNPRMAFRSKARRLLGVIGLVDRIRYDEGIRLLDEGPVKLHHRWSIRNSNGKSLLWNAMPRPDVLVIVTCDPAERLARMRAAGRPHIVALSDEDILGRTTGDVFARQFAEAHNIPVIEIDTTGGKSEVDGLKQQLRPWYSPDAAAARRMLRKHASGSL